MVLPKYFLLTARKILILPKSSKLGGAIAPPAPPAGTAMYTVATCKFHKLLQIFFLLLLKQQSFFILQANSTRTFLHVLFLQRKTLSFSIKKKKVNKRTKIYNYVKGENVAIATTTFSDFDVLVFCSRTFYGSCYLF